MHEEIWQAQSVSSKAGRLILILSTSVDQKVVRVTEVELDSQANICHLGDQKVRQASSESAPEESK